ncbi:zinc knuckle [Oesophagostomum dentatum]|uniref:Zinc knuckle n=1 Tax=Oesophagostomum dentatum TaxID=61180 RepID=A0A0B1TJG3_OESDE|nr:zinc knuckle [Oesophagostomum dentatum]
MSTVGSLKSQLTKAANALRKKKAEVDLSILDRLVLTGKPGEDHDLLYTRKTELTTQHASIKRCLDIMRQRWERAEKYAEQYPPDEGEASLLDDFQSHWDSLEADELTDEIEELLIRMQTALQLLPSDVTPYTIPSNVLLSSSTNASPTPTSTPAMQYTTNLHGVSGVTVVTTPQNGQSTYPSNIMSGQPAANNSMEPLPPLPSDTLGQQNVTSQPRIKQGYTPLNSPAVMNCTPLEHHPAVYQGTIPSLTTSSALYEQHVKLPTFELPEFSGDVDAFPEFWDLFSAAVHTNLSLPPAHKFLYLKSSLKGTASSIIANFQPTAENYDEAVKTILNTYNRPDVLRNKLWDKLLNYPKAANSVISQRVTLCGIKAIWAQMKKLSEHPAATGTMKIIRSKFPDRTREKVGELKKRGDPSWTVDNLLDALDTVIEQLELMEDTDPRTVLSSTTLLAQHEPRSHVRGRESRRSLTKRQSVTQSPNPSTLPPAQRLRRARCNFCLRHGHRADECRELRNPRERRQACITFNLCWRCFGSGHRSAQCDKPRCQVCDGDHNRLLCYQNLSCSRSPLRSDRYHQSHSPSRRHQSPHSPSEYNSRGDLRGCWRSPSASSKSASRSRSRDISGRRRDSPYPRGRVGFKPLEEDRPTEATHISACVTPFNQPTFTEEEDDSDCDVNTLSNHVQVVKKYSAPKTKSSKPPLSNPRLMIVNARTYNYCTEAEQLLVVFLDSGSQHSYIRKSTASSLGLKLKNPREITTLTFGGHKYSEVSHQVDITLYDQKNKPVKLTLWTRDFITTVPPNSNSCKRGNLTHLDICDYKSKVDVDVLIGIDYYWKVVDLNRNARLPSGFILSYTRFGPVLSGIENDLTQSNLAVSCKPQAIDAEELDAAELIILREHYREAVAEMQHQSVRKLNIEQDKDGIYRVNTRMGVFHRIAMDHPVEAKRTALATSAATAADGAGKGGEAPPKDVPPSSFEEHFTEHLFISVKTEPMDFSPVSSIGSADVPTSESVAVQTQHPLLSNPEHLEQSPAEPEQTQTNNAPVPCIIPLDIKTAGGVTVIKYSNPNANATTEAVPMDTSGSPHHGTLFTTSNTNAATSRHTSPNNWRPSTTPAPAKTHKSVAAKAAALVAQQHPVQSLSFAPAVSKTIRQASNAKPSPSPGRPEAGPSPSPGLVTARAEKRKPVNASEDSRPAKDFTFNIVVDVAYSYLRVIFWISTKMNAFLNIAVLTGRDKGHIVFILASSSLSGSIHA